LGCADFVCKKIHFELFKTKLSQKLN